jgi:hypothetical protein
VLWNQAVHIDREVKADRTDIIIENKKEEARILIDLQYLRTEMCKRKQRRS